MSGEPPGTAEDQDVDADSDRRRYLFAVDGGSPNDVLMLVCDLVADANGDLVIGNPVTVPDQTPLSMDQPRIEGERIAAKFALKAKQECQCNRSIEHTVVVSRSRDRALRKMVKTHGISTVVMEDTHPSSLLSVLGAERVDDSTLEDICDTIIVPRTNGTEEIDSVLVPVARGPHSGMAIDVGLALARQNEAVLELLHVYPAGDEEEMNRGEEVIKSGLERIEPFQDYEHTLHPADDIAEAIIDYTEAFDATVFGAPREGILRQFVFGTIPDSVSAEAEGTILVAHRGKVEGSWLDRWV